MVPPKNAFQKILKKTFSKKISWVVVTADQVQGGHAHGKIGEQKEKKGKKAWPNCPLRPTNDFLRTAAARPRRPATATASSTTATAATATRCVDRFGLATRYFFNRK